MLTNLLKCDKTAIDGYKRRKTAGHAQKAKRKDKGGEKSESLAEKNGDALQHVAIAYPLVIGWERVFYVRRYFSRRLRRKDLNFEAMLLKIPKIHDSRQTNM